MNSLGIYFGPKVISIVETKGRKLINNTQILQSTISTGELEEKVPLEAKEIEIIALFKDELRRKKIEAKEATICLSGRDLIIRTFEIPALPREEVQSAINFEVKKYIPFKVEELVSDFQLKLDRASRTNLVLFIGIKKESLDKYISILSQLDIKIKTIEYSAFSILRCLTLTGSSDNGVISILGVDLQEKDEVNFIVLENGFPLFSRDIVLTEGPGVLGKTEEPGPDDVLERLKTEIRVSLDYYHRKFPTKRIKKIFLISNQDYRLALEAFMEEIGLSTRFIDVTKHIDKTVAFSLSFIKGCCSSLSKVIKTNLKVNLLLAKEKAKSLKEKAIQKEAVSLLSGFRLDYKFVVLGLLICLAPFGYGLYHTQPLRKELNSIISTRTKAATVSPGATYKELTDVDSEYKRKLNSLDSLIKKQLYLTELLNIIPQVIPNGVWLTDFSFRKKDEGRAELILEGVVHLAATDKEFETASKFLSNLKENPDFTKYFKVISMDSLTYKEIDKLTVTNFLISCRTYQEKE